MSSMIDDESPSQPGRRRVLGLIGAAGLLGLAGCKSGDGEAATKNGSTGSAGSTASGGSASGSCVLVPAETDGPYPLYAMLSNASTLRSDIREDRTGVPLTLTMSLQDVNNSCVPINNAAVYIWHCDKDGNYSGYGSAAGKTWLRGIQLSNSNGQVTFTTVYPGWYPGRITHIHVQIYLNDNLAVTATAITQLAFPQEVTREVYNSSLYSAHGQNTSVSSFAADNVFSDGTGRQMLEMAGDSSSGYTAAITLGIAV
ncbi:MAG: intradiol ring-cleavage dioxygenase [Pedobacter sp.]|nr:intradiol ring-cleavage dioxygenase [Pedobacter sp.]